MSSKRTADGKSAIEGKEKEIVDVEFDFYDYIESDYSSIKTFMGQALGSDAADYIDLTKLTDLIIEQPVGSTVKCDGEDSDPFAMITSVVLTGSSTKNTELAESVKNFMLNKSQQNDNSKLKNLLEDSSQTCGWVISERLINMPWQVSAPLLKLLVEELDASAEESCQKCDYYIMICPVFQANDEAVRAEEVDKETTKRRRVQDLFKVKRKKVGRVNPSNFMDLTSFVHLEEDFIAQLAEFQFRLAISPPGGDTAALTASDSSFQLRDGRRGLVISDAKLREAVVKIEELLQQSEVPVKQERVSR